MLEIIIFAISLLAIIKGAGMIVNNAVNIAKKHNISEFIIGSTVIAFGTSLPEFASSVTAVLYNTPQIAVSNVIGSNIANIGLVLGITAVVFSSLSNSSILKRDIYCLLFSIIAFMIISIDYKITLAEGIAFLFIYISYIIYSIRSHKLKETKTHKKTETRPYLLLAIGLAMVGIGSNYLIVSGIEIIEMIGISASALGFIFIAIGTSLPELVTSLTAMKKNHTTLAVGNIIGSNIFNIFIIFGAMALIKTIPILPSFYVQAMPILAVLTILLCIAAFKKTLTRFTGIIFLILYLLAVVRIF